MATLKYKTPEGEWKKVSIGGGGSTEEVYVGSDAPTDDNVKVWIDPTGTSSGGNGGGSASGGSSGVATIYLKPGVLELTPSQIAHNINIRNVFVECFTKGIIPPMPQFVTELDGELLAVTYPNMTMYDTTPVFVTHDDIIIALMEDGYMLEV